MELAAGEKRGAIFGGGNGTGSGSEGGTSGQVEAINAYDKVAPENSPGERVRCKLTSMLVF